MDITAKEFELFSLTERKKPVNYAMNKIHALVLPSFVTRKETIMSRINLDRFSSREEPEEEEQEILLGSGVLNWPKGERVSDRYGCVHLSRDDNHVRFDRKINGEHGSLVAVVRETRQSEHIGDLFRGFFPETPEVGERIELGEGAVFFGEYESIGLRPDEDRDSDWLNPKALYRLHQQTVDLYFIPKARG